MHSSASSWCCEAYCVCCLSRVVCRVRRRFAKSSPPPLAAAAAITPSFLPTFHPACDTYAFPRSANSARPLAAQTSRTPPARTSHGRALAWRTSLPEEPAPVIRRWTRRSSSTPAAPTTAASLCCTLAVSAQARRVTAVGTTAAVRRVVLGGRQRRRWLPPTPLPGGVLCLPRTRRWKRGAYWRSTRGRFDRYRRSWRGRTRLPSCSRGATTARPW